ncbi:hypothetical protein QQF64_012149 [Cirrhinus molitorella]|uniref:Reverse transcriptase RNase H-like domain-containing protein n=1 Tax=Cirrhinus molitorella TaxID=172907 RepID=A0ABR3LY41_9TELE
MLAMFRGLKHFLPDLRGHNVLVRMDNTSVVAYINRQGGGRRPVEAGVEALGVETPPTFAGAPMERKWIYLRRRKRHTVRFGSPSRIQPRWGWMPWYRRGRGFVCTHFPRSLCSREFWSEFAIY